MIPEIQNKQNIAKWKKTYSVVNNAYDLIVTEGVTVCRNGASAPGSSYSNSRCKTIVGSTSKYGDQYFGYSDEFVDRFREILNPVSVCYGKVEPKCDNYGVGHAGTKNFPWAGFAAPSAASIYGTLKKPYSKGVFSFPSYNFNVAAFLLKDGSVVYIGGTHGGPWISVDVNGAAKGPNQIGRDFFQILGFDKKILPLGADGTYNKSANNGKCECTKNAGAERENYFAGAGGAGEVVSGGCCSAKYLSE